MNPVPFMFYREQLMRTVQEAPTSCDGLIASDAVSRAATSQSFIEFGIADVIVRIGPDVEFGLLTRVLRAARRSAQA